MRNYAVYDVFRQAYVKVFTKKVRMPLMLLLFRE